MEGSRDARILNVLQMILYLTCEGHFGVELSLFPPKPPNSLISVTASLYNLYYVKYDHAVLAAPVDDKQKWH